MKSGCNFYRLVTKIMNVTATIAMPIPAMILVVNASPNISVPTSMAVKNIPFSNRLYGLTFISFPTRNI